MRPNKTFKGFRLSERSLLLLKRLSDYHDTTETNIVERAIQEMARRQKILVPDREGDGSVSRPGNETEEVSA